MADLPTTLKEAVNRLAPQKRGKGRLDPAPGRSAIPSSTAIEYPSGDATVSSGIASPLTEQETSTEWYELRSSDGLFVLEVPARTLYTDASGREVLVVHRDPEGE